MGFPSNHHLSYTKNRLFLRRNFFICAAIWFYDLSISLGSEGSFTSEATVNHYKITRDNTDFFVHVSILHMIIFILNNYREILRFILFVL
ncbi:hypothetical protein SAMN06265361_10239 [Laceyella tengchongensis]|uniref:Uncharacterized protein n=1 Tax=Laceyella tengchongensis TaxID=574699 RepID=A0AA46ADX0_9BACL|nr:hypothetical protein SAMN06265361_10239 [Laceyella tengchongensis]